MRKPIVLLASLIALIAAGWAWDDLANAAPSTRTVKVLMHEPGCHAFFVGGKYRTTLSVEGPIRLFNYDEAALRVTGPGPTRTVKVGGSVLLPRAIIVGSLGPYKIKMVGQEPTDVTLRLTVR